MQTLALAAALDLATSTPLTEGGRYIQWALYGLYNAIFSMLNEEI